MTECAKMSHIYYSFALLQRLCSVAKRALREKSVTQGALLLFFLEGD
jgi:hypothetical protein